MKIFMIVDDSPVIRKVSRRIIEDLGLVVVEAEDGEEAVAMARENMPDGILVDWELAGRSGVEVIGQIASLPNADSAKIFYCTSEVMVPEMTKAKRAGATGFIMKPFDRNILREKLAEAGLLEDVAAVA